METVTRFPPPVNLPRPGVVWRRCCWLPDGSTGHTKTATAWPRCPRETAWWLSRWLSRVPGGGDPLTCTVSQ